MTIEEVRHIISQGEGVTLEFKDSRGGLPDSFYESAVSLSNTDGGIILLGVDDDGVIMGLTVEECKHMQKVLVTALNTPECVWPSIASRKQPYIRT